MRKEPKVSCDSAWGELHARSEKEGRKEIPLDRLVAEIATLRGVDSEELTERRHGHAERDLAMYLCRDVGQRELRAIGEVFGVKYSAVSYATKRAKQRLRKDRKYREEVDDARNTLIQLFET